MRGVGWVLWGGLVGLGCGEVVAPRVGCTAAPIFGGFSDPRELDQRERNAVVGIAQSAERAREGTCSGVLLAPGHVLTAGHCAERLPAEHSVFVGPALDAPVFTTRVARYALHGEQDLALAVLEQEVPPEHALPLQLATEDDHAALGVGAELLIAGYGLTETGELGTRLFVREPIVERTRDELVVDGRGRSGACTGDSGGPALVRDGEGRHRVAGILSSGSPSCLHIDIYVRVEPVASWLRGMLPDDGC